jgi:hypothetical protein
MISDSALMSKMPLPIFSYRLIGAALMEYIDLLLIGKKSVINGSFSES